MRYTKVVELEKGIKGFWEVEYQVSTNSEGGWQLKYVILSFREESKMKCYIHSFKVIQ